MLLSEEEQESASSFYSPLCKSKSYLTPEQRRKLREKRKVDFSPLSSSKDENVKSNKKVKRLFSQKPKPKVSKKEIKKKFAKVSLPEVRFTASEWVPKYQNSSGNKKFFKTRSPEHLKRAKFVLEYKKSRLDFTELKHSIFRSNSQDVSCHKPVQNFTSEMNNNETNLSTHSSTSSTNKINVNKLSNCKEMTENPHIVRVTSVDLECTQIIQEKTVNNLVLESHSDSILSDETVRADVLKPEDVKTDIQTLGLVPCSNVNILEKSKNKNYPIFYKENIKNIKWDTSPPEKPLNGSFLTKDKSKGCEQMIIDAGQSKIGAILCKTCGMIYTIGHEEDEKLHSENHHMHLHLKFPGWKDERVIGNYDDGRVIKILKEDKNFKLKKVQDILLVVNRDLGFPSAVFNRYLQGENVMIILFISHDKFAKGCLVAESVSSASPVVLDEKGSSNSYYASSKTVRAICGINRIWVAKENRKQKIASRMVDCLRSNFILGLVVSLEELAFTDPTEDGIQFAASYTGTKNFLVYK